MRSALVLILLCLTTAACRTGRVDTLPAVPAAAAPPTAARLARAHEAVPALDDATFRPASDAGNAVGDFDQVIGLVIDGEARAYPLHSLTRHGIVNDTVGGEPVVVSYCDSCAVGIVFKRRVGDQVLTFRKADTPATGEMVMIDRESGSRWSQVFGRAIEGQFEGQALEMVTATQTDWKTWRGQHPDTLVLVNIAAGEERLTSK